MANPVNRIDQTPLRISNNTTIARQTPKRDFGDRMKAGLDTAAGLVGSGAVVGAVTPAAVARVFQDVLDGISELEEYIRLRGAGSRQGMPIVMSEITQVKLQIGRLVQRATSNPR